MDCPHTRALCKRVRLRFPEIKILVGQWGMERLAATELLAAGADRISRTMVEFREQVMQISQILEPEKPKDKNSKRENATEHFDSETLT